jgi:hypothetical protein
MIVLIEASETSETKAEELWNILSAIYECNPNLYDLADDRRKLHAAELIVGALKGHQSRFGGALLDNLAPFEQLARKLAAYQGANGHTDEPVTSAEPASMYELVDNAGFDFDMDFHDIDWSFWSSTD